MVQNSEPQRCTGLSQAETGIWPSLLPALCSEEEEILSKQAGAFHFSAVAAGLLQFCMTPGEELSGIAEFGQTVSYLKR